MRKILFFFEPKQLPVLDSDGNVKEYKNSIACPASLRDSEKLRVKTSCAERGLSADRSNSVGFRKTLDVISQSRDFFGTSFQQIGYDDLSVMGASLDVVKSEVSKQ